MSFMWQIPNQARDKTAFSRMRQHFLKPSELMRKHIFHLTCWFIRLKFAPP